MGATSIISSETAELLRGVPALAPLDDPGLEKLSADVEHVSLRAGEWLFRAGDEASSGYVVAGGRLEVVSEGPEERVIRELRRGALIGELALLRGGRRSASVRARRDARLIRIERDRIEAALLDSPGFALRLVRTLAEQLATSAAAPRMRIPPRTFAVVSLDGLVDGKAAASALVEELRRYGSVAVMASEPTDAPEDWPACLARAEETHDRVVLGSSEADPADAWTAFCLAEADLIVAVTRGRPVGAWHRCMPALADCELVVCDGQARPEAIAAIRPNTVRAATGRSGIHGTMSELGRRVAGRAVTVVLSGGGARAFAHLGVLEELQGAGITIDEIAGVSMGAIIAALFARGDSPEEAYQVCQQRFHEQHPTRDYTLPLVSLLRGRKTARLLQEEFAGATIESLATRFLCTSTDLHRREQFVHRAGPVADALLASLAIPGVFPPVADGFGRLLVDGGVTDNLPLRAVSSWGGPIIAVDVTGTSFGRTESGGSRDPQPRTALLRRLATGSNAPLPGLAELVGRCMTLGSADTVAAARTHADLVITPDVAGIGLFDWRALPAMRSAGGAAARRALDSQAEIVARLTA